MSVLSSLKPTGSGRSRKMAKKKKKAVTKKRKRAVTKSSPVRRRKKRRVKKTTTMAVTPTKRRRRVKHRRRAGKARRVSHIYRGNINLTRLGGQKLTLASMQKFAVPAFLLFGGAVLFRMLDQKVLAPHLLTKLGENNKNLARGAIALLVGGGIAFASRNDKLQLLGFGIAAGGLIDSTATMVNKALSLSGGSTRVLGGSVARTIGGNNPFRINGLPASGTYGGTSPWAGRTAGGSARRIGAVSGASSTAGKSNDFPV
jgi:hypothetical protein